MGKQFADDLREGIVEFALGKSESIRLHLAVNHYPPVPALMVPVCIEAIDSYNANLNGDELIELPKGVSWRGNPSAPAWAIIESHHLDSWCDSDLDEWITREPQWQPTLITQENYADHFGDDLRVNELQCAWAVGQFFKNVGWIDYEGSYGYSIYFVPFYMLDEDGKILVNAETYDEREK